MTDTTSIPQGTPEWAAARLGKVTASRVSEVLAQGKNGQPSASRANYRAQLVIERLTNVATEGYQSEAMIRGSEMEADARRAYAFRTGHVVVETGFHPHPRIAMSGGSPDGLISTDGLVQFKCPGGAGHLDNLRGGIIPKAYRDQLTWELACTGRQWIDFVSYHPLFPESMTLAIRRVHLDVERLMEVENEVRKFLAEVDEAVADLRSRFEGPSLKEQLVASLVMP